MATGNSTIVQEPAPPPLRSTLTAVSCLSEDHRLTADVLVDATATSPIAVFQNAQRKSEALVVTPEGGLFHVYRDPTSDSGWNLRSVADFSVSEVVAARDIDGTVRAFLVGPGNELYHLWQNADGTWVSPSDLECKATNVAITEQFDENGQFVALVGYGVTPAGHVLIVMKDAASGAWAPRDFADNLSASVRLQLNANPFDSVWWLHAIIGGQLSVNPIGISPLTYDAERWTAAQPNPGTSGPGSVEQIALAPERFDTLLVVDEDHDLWAFYPESVSSLASFEQVASVPVRHVSVTQQAADATLIQAYITDVDGGLWVLRQSGWKDIHWDDTKTPAGQIPEWYDPVPLGDHLLRTFTPPGANDGAEVFAIDTGGALRSLSQDPITTAWTDVQIQRPALPDQPAHVSSYLTTATLLDENGVPLPGVQVAITSSTPTTVWVGGTAYDIGSNQPAMCLTDITGKLNTTSPALGLQTPSLTLTTTEGLAPPLVVTPAQEVHDYLAGGVQLNDLPRFDGNALRAATGADGAPLAPNLTSDGAQAAASGIAQAMSMRSAFAAAAPSSAARPAQPEGELAGGWMMDFSDPKTPTFKPMTAAEVAAHRASLEGELLGGFWDHLKHFTGDVWHAVEHAAIAVKNFVVDAANKVVHLTLSLADQVAHLVDVAIHDIEDVVHIIHSVFVAIGAAIKRALEWLRALFDWHDILNTRTVFEYYIKQSVPSLQHLITTRAEPLVDGFFAGLEKDVRQGCTDLKQMLGTKQTLATLPSYALPATEARALGRAGFDPVGLFSGPHRTWVFDKARANAAGSTGLEMSQDEALKQPVADLVEAVESARPDLQNALRAWEDFINTMVKQPADFKTLVVVELIDVLEGVIVAALKFTDGVIKALLDLVNAALDGLEKFLTQPVHIPLLSPLFEEISGEDLTVAGLVALIAAAPTTISYKLAFGVDHPPFTDTMVRQLTSATRAARTEPAAVGDSPGLTTALTYSSACVQALWALFDTCLDAAPDVESKKLDRVLSAIDIGWPLLSQGVSWPTGETGRQGDIPTNTAYDRWNLGAWACYWVPPLLDSALLAVSFVPAKSGGDTSWGKLARYVDPAGKVACSAIGLVTLGVGITASVLGRDGEATGGTIASNVLGPISYIGQPLRINSNVESSEGLTLAIQLLNDFFTGEGCAVAIAAS